MDERLFDESKVLSGLYKEYKKNNGFSGNGNSRVKIISESYDDYDNKEIITEGIKFFKNSKRLRKVADKLMVNYDRSNSDEDKKNLKKVSLKMYSLADKFEKVEDDYKYKNKEIAKNDYRELCEKYKDICLILKKESVKSTLKTVSSLALTIASLALSYFAVGRVMNALGNLKAKIIVPTEIKGGSVTASLEKNTPKTETSGKEGFFDSIKRYGIWSVMQLPISGARNLSTNAIDSIQTQNNIIQSVENVFPELRI